MPIHKIYIESDKEKQLNVYRLDHPVYNVSGVRITNLRIPTSYNNIDYNSPADKVFSIIDKYNSNENILYKQFYIVNSFQLEKPHEDDWTYKFNNKHGWEISAIMNLSYLTVSSS